MVNIIIKKSSAISALCLLLSLSFHASMNASAITYELSGRFGDNLLTFCRAQWLAHKYGIPLKYEAFKFSDCLMMHERVSAYDASRYQRIGLRGREVPLDKNRPALYVACYYMDLDQWDGWENNGLPQIHDVSYIAELKELIKPRVPVELIPLPDGMVSIAVHVRKGSGDDHGLISDNPQGVWSKYHYMDCDFPYKFPPDEFYINEIRYLAGLLKDQPLYVHIFTDHKQPEIIVEKYAVALNNPRITFGYRQAVNADETTLLDDMFSMARFEYLIRPDSSFSKVAQLIGDHVMAIYPKSHVWDGNRLIITETAIKEGEKITRKHN